VVHACHEYLKVGNFIVCDGWLIVDVIIILEYLREHVGNGLAFWVSHCVDGSVCTFSHELMLQAVTLAVASDNSACLPEGYLVKEFLSADSYFANEQLI
jgi:hypothetical protein